MNEVAIDCRGGTPWPPLCQVPQPPRRITQCDDGVATECHGETFSITERLKFQLRGEFFNVFNHVNFDESTAAGNFAMLSTGKEPLALLPQLSTPALGK